MDYYEMLEVVIMHLFKVYESIGTPDIMANSIYNMRFIDLQLASLEE